MSECMQGTLAVVSQTGESLSFYDMPSGKHITRLESLYAEPHELCYDPKRNLLYISHAYRHGNYWAHGDDSHEISIVDLDTLTITDFIDTRPAKGPHGLYIDHTRDILYSSVEVLPDVEVGGGIIGIDLSTKKTVKTIPSGYRSHWFTMTPDGKKAYTCNKTAPFISVIDLENEKWIGKIEAPSTEEPSMSLDGRYAYFPTPGFNPPHNAEDPKIQVVDTTIDQIVRTIKLDHGAIPVHVSPLGSILVGQYHFPDKAQLAIYSDGGDEHKLLGTAEIGKWPLTIRSSTDGKTAFVANVLSGTVSVVDLLSHTTVHTIEVDAKRRDDKNQHVGAHGLAFIPHKVGQNARLGS